MWLVAFGLENLELLYKLQNNELLPESGAVLHFPALTLRDSGNYTCTWKTNTTSGSKTISLQVEDLKVSLIRLSGNGTLKPGDSLNLTCDVTCTQSSSQFVWSKNNELLPESGAVLHFPALTLRDSGNYTCTWKTNTTSGSKTISLQVEEHPDQWSIWMIVCVIAGLSLIIILGAVIYNRRSVHAERQMDDCEHNANVQQNKDDFDLHAHVQQSEDDSDIYANVQQKEDNSDIYANV
ncbi:hypothetical protein HF521_011055 [Silurus meridionalis]|uniref:Ig-like domain-containing protein n=1 Tax=Silurus meridionalis TaxID=175797 RepID=A0A8T0AN19_SILME|nr:hypothetical protein HF521_011055 [Silurus meridionalis]